MLARARWGLTPACLLWPDGQNRPQEEAPQRATVPTPECLLVTVWGFNPVYSTAFGRVVC